MPRSRSETPVSRRSRSPLSDRDSSPERPTEYRVHVAELEPGVDENEIRKIFQRFGALVDVWVASASCFGFVVYKYKDDAQKAIDQMDGRYDLNRTSGAILRNYHWIKITRKCAYKSNMGATKNSKSFSSS